MMGFSPGLPISSHDRGVVPMCKFCPKYNIPKQSPNQLTCGSAHCRYKQALESQKKCRKKKRASA